MGRVRGRSGREHIESWPAETRSVYRGAVCSWDVHAAHQRNVALILLQFLRLPRLTLSAWWFQIQGMFLHVTKDPRFPQGGEIYLCVCTLIFTPLSFGILQTGDGHCWAPA